MFYIKQNIPKNPDEYKIAFLSRLVRLFIQLIIGQRSQELLHKLSIILKNLQIFDKTILQHDSIFNLLFIISTK